MLLNARDGLFDIHNIATGFARWRTLSLLKFSPRWNRRFAVVSEDLIFNALHPVSSLALTLAYFLLGGGGAACGTPPMGFACRGIAALWGQLAWRVLYKVTNHGVTGNKDRRAQA